MGANYKLEELFIQADQDIRDGYLAEAAKKLESIIADDPDFGKAYNHLGYLYETKFKDLKSAENYYQLALEKSPDYPAVYANYSILLSTLRKYDELNTLLQKALEIPGVDKANVYNEYGIMYENLGEYSRAISNYKECAKLTFNKNTIDKALESIDRCNTKMKL
jgi:tetratricopeptide (TPR) repeat protein